MKISKEQLCLLIEWVRYYVFPDVAERPAPYDAQTMIGEILRRQISVFPEVEDAQETVNQFIDHIPELSRLIHTDVKAVRHNDPAVRSTCEVVLCYPVVSHRPPSVSVRCADTASNDCRTGTFADRCRHTPCCRDRRIFCLRPRHGHRDRCHVGDWQSCNALSGRHTRCT